MAISNPYTAPQAEVADVDNAYHGAFQEMKIWAWRGRLGRLRFLAYGAVAYLIYMVLTVAFTIPAAMFRTNAATMLLGFLIMLMMIPYFVFSALVLIRRSHDMGWSGWMSLLAIIPLVGLIWIFKAGSPGANAYGAPPPPNTTGVKVAAFGIFGVVILIGILAAIALPAYQQYVQRAQAARQVQSK
ncbi:MAG TPA: DUF805 domain-containing protein [Ideonella sp.]|uniref:DUF805 domain-containing protein n=1 Tax=Ideonella sp. TaxID=1929293 RepID=UPI002C26EDFC|nr:DUF805 domain-containing protein [Ideonella sp.]HSI50270.1 DUF805 domain-containing protein [Ideonella sp.]